MSFGLLCLASGCKTPRHPTPPTATRGRVRGAHHRSRAKGPRLVGWGSPFGTQVREPTLERSKCPSRTMIAKLHGFPGAVKPKCVGGWSRLSLVWAGGRFPPQSRNPRPASFYLLPYPQLASTTWCRRVAFHPSNSIWSDHADSNKNPKGHAYLNQKPNGLTLQYTYQRGVSLIP